MCNLCGSKDYEVIWDKKKRSEQGTFVGKLLPTNNLFVQCRTCGLVYIQNPMSQTESDEYYKEEYRKTYNHDLKAEISHADNALNFLRQLKMKRCKALDVGCSKGVLVDMLVKAGYDAYGIDPYVQENERIICSTIEKYDGEYGLITCLNTLEHFHDPMYVLKKFRGMTDNLLIVVPNLYTSLCRLMADGFMSNMHLYHFDTRTIKNYLELAGFEIVASSIVVEYNMDKLYVFAKASDKKETTFKYTPFDVRRLLAMDILTITNHNFMEGL